MPIVTGMGLSFKMRGFKNAAISFFGDGASNEGAFHEAINMAAAYDIPAVFVCENNLYGASTHVSMDYTIPIGKAEILKEGTDVTILSTLLMLHRSLNVADQLKEKGISCEVIDLRSLVPLDTECILNSVKKTGKVVIVEECTKRGGWGAEVAATIAESIPEHLLAPIKRVAALDTPVPFAPVMENYYVPSVEKIMEGILETVQY